MKPVRLPASATNALPRWGLIALCLLYILPGLIGRDPWKNLDAASFGIEWTMAHGNLNDWLWPHIGTMTMAEKGPLAFWLGALCIRLFGWLLGDPMASRIASIAFFLLGSLSVWFTAYVLGCRPEAQPLRLAFGGQPEPKDYGRTLADGALLIYLGCLGLLYPIHTTSAEALQISLVAFAMYLAVKLFELQSARAALKFGVALGLLVLTRGWVVPIMLWLCMMMLAIISEKHKLLRLLLLSLLSLIAVTSIWVVVAHIVLPFNSSPIHAWMRWNAIQIAWPSWESLKYLLKYGIWFAWPAWPFAGWSVYAWRNQYRALHIALPLSFFCTFIVLSLLNPTSEFGTLLPLLPPLAILAAFGLPTMKRGGINAVDWFSVMILTIFAAGIWMYWVSLQTGWPLPAQKVLKLLPGFKPEFQPFAFLVACAATVGWFFLVHWRISRQPSVLWRAVVLSTGGGILCWLLLMTLWLPSFNYAKSYSGVAAEIASKVQDSNGCVETDVGADQLGSFAYFGKLRLAQFDSNNCEFLLLQENSHNKEEAARIRNAGNQWKLLWEGRRPSDRDERFRLYKRTQ